MLHIKVMLRQSDDTESLVSMNFGLDGGDGCEWINLDIYP